MRFEIDGGVGVRPRLHADRRPVGGVADEAAVEAVTCALNVCQQRREHPAGAAFRGGDSQF